jgi:ubiquitin-conjugating enzyme E2 H
MSWQKRLARDIQDLKDAGFQVMSEDGSSEIKFEQFCVLFHGPKDTPYEGGTWRIRFTITDKYPFASPSVGFIEHILHPNIDWASGSICLDALNKKWSPIFTLKHIVDSLLPYLLTYPNPEDPLNRDAASLMLQNNTLYLSRVLDATKRYAIASKKLE